MRSQLWYYEHQMLHFQLSSFSFDLLSSYLSLLLICRNNSLASSHVCLMFKERRPLYQMLDLLYEILYRCNYIGDINDNSSTYPYYTIQYAISVERSLIIFGNCDKQSFPFLLMDLSSISHITKESTDVYFLGRQTTQLYHLRIVPHTSICYGVKYIVMQCI